MLLVQIVYLDNLKMEEYPTNQMIKPRVICFTKEMMDKFAKLDKIHTATQEYKFGKRPVRISDRM